MIAKIKNLFNTGSFETIRDRIALILKIELENQFNLSVIANNPEPVYNAAVYLEKKSVVNNESMPLITVNFDSTTIRRAVYNGENEYNGIFYIDIYVAKTKPNIELDTNTEEFDLSQENSIDCAKLISAITKILFSPYYNTLGFDAGLIGAKKISTIDVDDKNEFVDSIVPCTARIIFEVVYIDNVEQLVPIPLDQAITIITVGEGDEVTYSLDYYSDDSDIGLQTQLQSLLG